MVHYDGFRILITGDLDETGELEMLKHYEAKGKINRLKADILKVGHHGSSTSTSDKFLETVNPRIAVFQVGAYNIYGHPDQKIVEKCQKNGIMVKRNDYNGGIGFSFYENQISVHTVIP
jgi:competence protein ComEC